MKWHHCIWCSIYSLTCSTDSTSFNLDSSPPFCWNNCLCSLTNKWSAPSLGHYIICNSDSNNGMLLFTCSLIGLSYLIDTHCAFSATSLRQWSNDRSKCCRTRFNAFISSFTAAMTCLRRITTSLVALAYEWILLLLSVMHESLSDGSGSARLLLSESSSAFTIRVWATLIDPMVDSFQLCGPTDAIGHAVAQLATSYAQGVNWRPH